jgi:hypothetical protein
MRDVDTGVPWRELSVPVGVSAYADWPPIIAQYPIRRPPIAISWSGLPYNTLASDETGAIVS